MTDKIANEELKKNKIESNSSQILFDKTLITLICGIVITVVTISLQGHNDRILERQKHQGQLIMQAIETGDVTNAKQNLTFLAELGLIDFSVEIIKEVVEETHPSLPAKDGNLNQQPDQELVYRWAMSGFGNLLNKDYYAAVDNFDLVIKFILEIEDASSIVSTAVNSRPHVFKVAQYPNFRYYDQILKILAEKESKLDKLSQMKNSIPEDDEIWDEIFLEIFFNAEFSHLFKDNRYRITLIQSYLHDMGFFDDTIDGSLGIKTRKAISQFSVNCNGEFIDEELRVLTINEDFNNLFECLVDAKQNGKFNISE